MQTAGWRASCRPQVGGPHVDRRLAARMHACRRLRASCMPRLAGLMQAAGWQAACMPRLAGLMQTAGWQAACMCPGWQAACVPRLAGLMHAQVGGPHAGRRLVVLMHAQIAGLMHAAGWRASCMPRLRASCMPRLAGLMHTAGCSRPATPDSPVESAMITGPKDGRE